VAYIDQTTAYYTVHHGLFLKKLYQTIKKFKLTNTISMLLSNRRFDVTLQEIVNGKDRIMVYRDIGFKIYNRKLKLK